MNSLYNHELKEAQEACGVTGEDMSDVLDKMREIITSINKTSQFVERMEEYLLEGNARKKLICILLTIPKMISDAINPMIFQKFMERLSGEGEK